MKNTIFITAALLVVSALQLSMLSLASDEYHVSNAEEINTYLIKDIIDQLIEKLREAIPEVIKFPSINIQLPENKFLTGYLHVRNSNLTGLKEFKATVKYIFLIPTSFTLILESININLEYLTDLSLFNIPLLSIFGKGNGSVAITNFIITGNIALGMPPSINSMQISIDDAEFIIDGLCNDPTLNNQVSDILNDNVSKLVNENEKAISYALENIINGIINNKVLPNSVLKRNYGN